MGEIALSHGRPLGEHERLLDSRQCFSGIVVLQVLHLGGAVETGAVRSALDWLQRRHPMLRAHIRYGGLVFRGVPPFVYRQPRFELSGTRPLVLEESTDPWRDVVSRELGRGLPGAPMPRLRFTLVREPERDLTHIVICADHAMLDATACNMMARDLLEYLADPRAMEAMTAVHTALPPPLDEGLAQRAENRSRPYRPGIRLPLRPVPRGRRGTRILARRLEADATDAHKATARRHAATLHGAEAAAFLLAMRQVYGIEEMTCLSSLDLRRFRKPPVPADTFGAFVDVLRTYHKIGPDLWPTARDVTFRLAAAIARDERAASVAQLPGWRALAAETLPTLTHRNRIDGLGITTAGDSGFRRRYGNHTLEDISMAVSLDIIGPGLLVIGVEREGALELSVCYAARTLADADATAMADKAMAALAAAAGEGQGPLP
jgi:hypothetical protein